MNHFFSRQTLVQLALLLGTALSATATWAQEVDPPGRVGRLADVQGRVWFYDTEQGQWVEGQRNRVLTSGDRISTERGARAQVSVGSTELRLDGETEVAFSRIDDERMVFELAGGSVALQVRSREMAREIELLANDVRVMPERDGHYRVDDEGEITLVSAWRGTVNVDARNVQAQVNAGQRAQFYRDTRNGALAYTWAGPVNDEFSDWVARDERSDLNNAPRRYVSPEMTGAEELDRYGRWDRHPDYGMVWFPTQVSASWVPYRDGRWVWRAQWGWTWLDDAPWGFAPFHYGRWVNWGGRWAWSPGGYVARPVFAPALVAWTGGSNWGVSVSVGGGWGPAVGWLPLAPRDIYVPPYRYDRRYYDRVNEPHRPFHPRQVPTGPIMYGNKGVPNAVTVVPADVLTRRQPVAPAVVRTPDVQRAVERGVFQREVPVPGRAQPPRVVAVPGGAEPVRRGQEPGRPRVPDGRDAGREPGRVIAVPGGAVPAAPAVQEQRRIPPAPGREAGRTPRVIDLRREQAQPAAPPQPSTAQQPAVQPPSRVPGPQGEGRAPVFRAPQPVPQATPPARPAAPAPQPAARNEREQRNDRNDKSERDDRQRTPESRQNLRERQNVN